MAARGTATSREFKANRDDGFTLAEVLVALSVLMIVLLAASYLVLGSMKAASNNQLAVTATNLAQEDLQRMRALNQSANAQIVSGTAQQTVGPTTFTLTRTVTQCTASTSGGVVTYSCGATASTCGAGGYKSVNTSVSWNGTHRPIALMTRIAC